MSAARLLSTGTALFRNRNTPLSSVPSLCFLKPFPPLRFHLYCSSSVAIDAVNADVADNADSNHHPWPEWVTFINRLKTTGYFANGIPEGDNGSDKDAIDYKDIKQLKDACLSFARDRYDVLKSLSRKEIQTVVEVGCPNLLRKAVNSAKRLRAHVKLDEGEVCSTCHLRGSCDRAYGMLKESEGAPRTADIVRILMYYALDPVTFSGENTQSGRVLVEASARKLLSELVELSDTSPIPAVPKSASRETRKREQPVNTVDGNTIEMKKGDWICSKCNFMNFGRNVRCMKCKEDGPKFIGVDDTQKKAGDWNCPGCGFMNFASNKTCLRCRDLRPKRELNPGEWECPSCDFVNFRRNIVCKKCNCDRPKDNASGYGGDTWTARR